MDMNNVMHEVVGKDITLSLYHMHKVWPRLLLQGVNLELSLKDSGMIQIV